MKKILSFLLLGLLLSIGYAWGEDKTDVLTASLFSATSTTYTDFSGVSVENGSNAVYKGNSAKTNSGGIQLRSKNSNSGIVSTTSGGDRIKSVSIIVESGSNTLDIYGSNNAYSGASDLYGSSKGTKLGSLNATGSITVTGDYKYIGIRSNSGAIYLTNITIVWETSGGTPQPTTYSVTYNANGATSGSVPEDDNEYDEDDEVTVLGNTGSLAKTGYIFAGWNENAAGTGADISGTFTITQDTTLYAKWTAKTITGLSYTGTPTKTSYNAGESFASAGLTVTATFNDESQEDVTASVDWTPNPLTMGTTSVTGTYMGQTVNVPGLTVTATPGSAENPYTTISAIFDAATSTETAVYVTFDNWVVSGVSTNGKNIFVTDGTNGFVIYFSTDMSSTFAAGKILSGTAVPCTLKLYNGFAELIDLNTEDLTITTGGTISPANVDMADLAGINTGALLSYNHLTCSVSSGKYYLSDGTTTLQVYNALYAFSALEDGKIYDITGVYQQYKETKEILPRSADDIVKVAVPSIDLDKTSINAEAAGANGTIAITYENLTINDANDFGVAFYDAYQNELATAEEPDWVVVGFEAATAPAEGYVVSYIIGENDGAARTAYMKVYALADDYVYSELITISQAEYVAPFEITDGVFDFENAGKANPIVDYGSGEVLVTTGYTKATKTWTAVNVTMTTGVASGNGYRWWNADKTLRFYSGAYATFSVPAGNIITKIETTGANFDSADKGNLSGSTWTGVANSVKLSVTGTRNIKSITVTYGTSATLTLGAGGWSTFAAPFAYTVSDNVTVYKAAVNNEKTAVVLSEVTGVIPAGAGIILNGTEGAAVTITPSESDGTIENNQLVGTITPKAVTADDNAYVISTFEDGTKFNKCGSVTIPAHKAYIVIEDAQGSAPIRIEFAENNTTDIKAIEASEKAVKFFENGNLYILRDGVVYDAMGKMVR